MLRTLFKQSSLYFMGLMGNKVLTVFMWIMLARLFDSSFVGTVILFLTVGEVVTFIADFGLNQWYMKTATPVNRDERFTEIIATRTFTLILSAALLSLFLTATQTFTGIVSTALMLSLVPKAMLSILDGYLLERKQSFQIAIKNAVITLLFLSGFLMMAGMMTIESTVILYTASLMLTTIIFFPWKLAMRVRIPSPKQIQSTLSASASYAMLILSSYLYARGDTILIGYLDSATALGAYGMAYRYLESLSLFPSAIVQNLFPISAKKGSVSGKQLHQMTLIMMLLGIIAAFALYATSEILVITVLGRSYAAAVPILRIFCVVLFLFFMNAPLSAVIQSSDLVRKFLPFGVLNTLLNLALNIITIPIYGAIGAAWIMAFTEFTGLIINVYFAWRLYPPQNRFLRHLLGFMITDEDRSRIHVAGNGYSIVIVHWNTPGILKKQLKILSEINDPEITVIDNASAINTSWVTHEFPQVKLIQNHTNRGFAAANNQGALISTREWLVFLNPDVHITKEEIENLIRYAKEHNLDACSPTPESDDYRKPVPSWWTLLVEFSPLKRYVSGFMHEIVDHETLTGGCLLIHSSVFKKLGGWDERYFLWFEDSDLTKRLLDGGFHIGWAPFFVNHIGGVSFADLTIQEKRDIFFHAMEIYAKTHSTFFGQAIIGLIRRRFSKRKTLRQLNRGVSIVVPNMKSELLITFFENNEKTIGKMGELIVVTSAIDGSDIWEWRRLYPQVRFIPIDENYGFASTVNIGMRVATGAWIGTVNDDCILSEDWIEKCTTVNGGRIGGVNPVIFRTDRTVESAGIQILPRGKAIPQTILPKHNQPTDALNAAAVLYKNEALNDVGLFDEAFGSYLEDIDLSMRMKQKNWENIVVPTAAVMHKGHATSSTSLGGKKAYYDFKNWIILIGKNWTLEEKIRFAPELFVERLRNIAGMIKAIL